MASPESRKLARSFVAGIVVFALIGGVLYLTFKAQTGLPFAPTTTVQASIDNVHSLRVNDDVRQNSKRIGRVSDIQFSDGHALVTMQLDGHQDVYQNARAAVWDVSALATKFVELDPGTPAAGPLGDHPIAATRNVSSSDLYQLLDVLDPQTRDAATRTIREVGGGVAGHSHDLHDLLSAAPNLLTDLGTTSQTLASPEEDLPSVLRSADQLASHLQGRDQQIAALVKQSDDTFRAVSADHEQPLNDTLQRLPSTLDRVRPALDKLDKPLADAQAAMTSLQPGAAALAQSEPDLRGVLREGVPVAHKVPGVADEAKPAVEDLTHTFADARPLAPRVTQALGDLETPLQVLAPYAPEIGELFVRGHSVLSEGPAPGIRYFRINANPGAATVTGGLLGSSNFRQDQYPAPGQADKDRAGSGLPPGIPGGN